MATTAADDDLAGELRRLQRLCKFGEDTVRRVRVEMARGGPGGPDVEARIGHVVALTARLRGVIDLASHLPPPAARRQLEAARPEALIEAQKALMAATVTKRPPLPTSTGRLASIPMTTRLAEMLGSNTPLSKRPPSQRRRHLVALLRFGKSLLGYVSPRMQAVESALNTTKRHAGGGMGLLQLFKVGQDEAQHAGVAPTQVLWVPRLLKLNLDHPTAARVEQHVVNQWGQAKAVYTACGALNSRVEVEGEPPLAAYDPGQATGALMPLAHLSATVKDVPVLNELFPSMVVAPPWEGWRRDLEDLAEAPPPPAPAMMAAAPEVPVAAPDASRQRLSAIVAYINNPKGDPLYADPTVMFRVVADEHLFQQQAGQALRERLKLAPATQWPQIQEELAVATKRQGQMQTLLRRLAAQQRPG